MSRLSTPLAGELGPANARRCLLKLRQPWPSTFTKAVEAARQSVGLANIADRD
jgi:hypothetical protein